MKLKAFAGLNENEVQDSFSDWVALLQGYAGSNNFLKSVEEWIRVVHKDKSDTLFVVISFFFEKINGRELVKNVKLLGEGVDPRISQKTINV